MPPATFAAAPVIAATTAHLTGEMVSIPISLELLAVVVASVTGALTAREEHLDLVGAIALAIVCSLGGGLLRDMTLQVGNVYILNQPLALPAAIITAAITFIFPRRLFERQDRLIAVLDIFSVGLYAATGADKSLVYGFAPLVCIMMGFFTGVGGGMLRDICLGRTPNIFQQSNLYAVAAIAGASVYVALVQLWGIPSIIALIACVAITMGLRWLSLHYDIKSPTDMDVHRTLHRARRQVRIITQRRGEPQTRTEGELAERRQRVQADIEKRRRDEHRRARRALWRKTK